MNNYEKLLEDVFMFLRIILAFGEGSLTIDYARLTEEENIKINNMMIEHAVDNPIKIIIPEFIHTLEQLKKIIIKQKTVNKKIVWTLMTISTVLSQKRIAFEQLELLKSCNEIIEAILSFFEE